MKTYPFNMKKTLYFLTAVLLLSSCGVITRTRYGNGLKINLGETWSKPDKQKKAGTERSKHKLPQQTRESFGHPISEEIQPEIAMQIENPDAGGKLSAPVLQKTQLRELRNFTKTLMKPHYESKPETKAEPENTVIRKESSQEYYRPWEPHIKTAAYLSLLIWIPYLGGVAFITAFVLCWIGLSNINQSMGAFRGKGFAIFLIVLFIISLLFSLMFYALLFLFFF